MGAKDTNLKVIGTCRCPLTCPVGQAKAVSKRNLL